MSEMSSPVRRVVRLKAPKPPQPWNPSTSPMAKEKKATPSLKQPPKVSPSRSGTSQAGERSSGGSPRKVKMPNPLGERQYESARVSGSPTKRMIAPRLVKAEDIPLPDSINTPPRTKEFFSSLLKGSGLGLTPLQSPSVAHVIPSKNHIADIMPIPNPASPLCDVPRYSMDIKSFFTSPSKRRKDCDEHEGPAGLEVKHPQAKAHMVFGRDDIQRDGFYRMRRPASSIADADDESETLPDIHDAGSSAEALILKINPSIMIRKPRSRRLAIASDPVQATVPMHEESLKYQAKQYVTHTLSGRSLLGDGAFQKKLRADPPLKDESGRQEKTIVDQPGDSESAYQAMLKKAHFKPDQASRPNTQHMMQPEYEERAREARAFIDEHDLSKHKTLQDPASAPSGTDQHNIALTNSKPSKNNISSDGNEIHKAKVRKQDVPRQGSIIGQKSCPKSDQIHQYEPLWMNVRPGDTDNFAKMRERSSRQQPQPNLGIGVSSTSKNDASKIPLGRTTFGGHSTQSILFPDMESRPAVSMPQRGRNKSVRWDPAITFIGPIIKPKNKKVTAEAKFDKLFDKGKEKAKDCEDANIDLFVETFKQWKKGDKKKLEMLLKALREIEVDSETDSTNPEKAKQNQRDNSITQPRTTPLDPRVPEFSPSNLKENEVWIWKPRPYVPPTPVPPTPATPAPSPIISASVNILSLPLQERIPQTILGDPAIAVIQDQSPLRTDILSNLGTSTQSIKKRVIWDNPDADGREAVMLSQRFAAEYLEGFMKKYPLTGQKAAVMPKKRLEDLPIAKDVGNTLKITKMQTNAAEIQQKLEVLLLKKKEAKAIKTR